MYIPHTYLHTLQLGVTFHNTKEWKQERRECECNCVHAHKELLCVLGS